MRKIAFILLMLLTLSLSAQEVNVVKFMGIPVDGTKSEMISHLKKKGFTYNPTKDYLTGKFNGLDAIISVVEYNGKVCRILVQDANVWNETDIIIRFNNLIEQFERSGKYEGEQDKIDFNEDIHYEMAIHHKRYQAIYRQKSDNDPKPEDCILDFPTDEVTDDFIDHFHNQCVELAKSLGENSYEHVYLKQLNEIQDMTKEKMFEFDKDWLESICLSLQIVGKEKRRVWFMINEDDNMNRKYSILLFYENGFNMPNGEDL